MTKRIHTPALMDPKYRKWLENKDRLIMRGVLVDKELYQKIQEIATKRFGSRKRHTFLILNEALEEYVERHYNE